MSPHHFAQVSKSGGMSAAKHKHPPHQGSKRSGDEWADIGAQAHRLDADYDTYDEDSENEEASGPGSGWGSGIRVVVSRVLNSTTLGGSGDRGKRAHESYL